MDIIGPKSNEVRHTLGTGVVKNIRKRADIVNGNNSFRGKGKGNLTDIMLAQGKYEADIFSRVFSISSDRFAIIGLPRNDELIFGNNIANIKKIKRSMSIPDSKIVILYAPTFREYKKDDRRNCIMDLPLDIKKWKNFLGEKYIFLLRAHYEVVRIMNVQENSVVRDASDYQNLNELMLVSDILISDYSSIFFDYSILGRPMTPYCYDYDEYSKKRGVYLDIRKALCCHINNEIELINEIKHIDIEKRSAISRIFCDKYIESAGESAKLATNLIYESIVKKKV